jgi:hypothetical protein
MRKPQPNESTFLNSFRSTNPRSASRVTLQIADPWQDLRGSIQNDLIFFKSNGRTLAADHHPTQWDSPTAIDQCQAHQGKFFPQHRTVQCQIDPFATKCQTHHSDQRIVYHLNLDPFIVQPARQRPLFARRLSMTLSIDHPLAQMNSFALQQTNNRPKKGGKTAHVMKPHSILEYKVGYVTI